MAVDWIHGRVFYSQHGWHGRLMGPDPDHFSHVFYSHLYLSPSLLLLFPVYSHWRYYPKLPDQARPFLVWLSATRSSGLNPGSLPVPAPISLSPTTSHPIHTHAHTQAHWTSWRCHAHSVPLSILHSPECPDALVTPCCLPKYKYFFLKPTPYSYFTLPSLISPNKPASSAWLAYPLNILGSAEHSFGFFLHNYVDISVSPQRLWTPWRAETFFLPLYHQHLVIWQVFSKCLNAWKQDSGMPLNSVEEADEWSTTNQARTVPL